jgi:hypothetical protein
MGDSTPFDVDRYRTLGRALREQRQLLGASMCSMRALTNNTRLNVLEQGQQQGTVSEALLERLALAYVLPVEELRAYRAHDAELWCLERLLFKGKTGHREHAARRAYLAHRDCEEQLSLLARKDTIAHARASRTVAESLTLHEARKAQMLEALARHREVEDLFVLFLREGDVVHLRQSAQVLLEAVSSLGTPLVDSGAP